MKFNRLGAFTLGVVITAVSVGAVSFVNAAGNETLKACANKTTGVMRYISKGSCKKTETSLSWNQMGPQGLPGNSGTNGTNGTAGAKGDTGAAGAKGETGAAGASAASTLKQRVLLGGSVGRYWLEAGSNCASNISTQAILTTDSGSKYAICSSTLNDVVGSSTYGYIDSLKAWVP